MKRLSKSDIRRAVEEYDKRHKKPEPEDIDNIAKGDPLALAELAAWRRAGHGVWHGVYMAEGYDEEYHQLAPGRFSKSFAEALMRINCADQLMCSIKYVFLLHINKES